MIRAILLLLALAACTPAAPPILSVDPRVAVQPGAGVIVANPAAVSIDRSGFTDVSVELRNPNAQDVAVQCVVDWFDVAGHPLGGLAAVPTRIGINALGAEFCRTVPPNPGARGFRITIAPTY